MLNPQLIMEWTFVPVGSVAYKVTYMRSETNRIDAEEWGSFSRLLAPSDKDAYRDFFEQMTAVINGEGE